MDEYFIEEKSNLDKFMDFLVFLAVFAVTIFLILDIISASGKGNLDWDRINAIYFYINIAVFLIFLADLYRLFKAADNIKMFFKSSWLDILATIPFGLIAQIPSLQVLKWARLSRLGSLQKASKISKISKEFKAAAHLKKESEEYQKKHRL